LSQSHLAKHHDDTALPLSRQRLPDRRRRVLAHRGIQANAPGRTALGIQLLVIRRALSNYQRHREWDIELLFKRFKSLLGLGDLPAKQRNLARSWIFAKLILALLAEKAARKLAESSPCAAA
jgi:hypothetical protein